MAERNRDLSLWQALVWVYRDQMAHLYLKSPADWYLWAIAIDGPVDDMPRATVHPDAARLHAAVTALPLDMAQLLVHFALEQQQPQPPTQMPSPYPIRVHHGIGLGEGERWGQMATARGGRISYLIRWLEQIAIVEPIMKRYGKRMRKIGQRTVQNPIEFCPIDWQPSLAFVIMLADTHRRWVEAMRHLQTTLITETWQSISLGEDGIENPRVVDITDMADGMSRAREQGWLREVEIDEQEAETASYRGVDEESGEGVFQFLTRHVRIRTKPKRDSGVASGPGLPRFSAR